MGRHQAPEAPGHGSAPEVPPAADEPPTERIDPVRTPPTYRLPAAGPVPLTAGPPAPGPVPHAHAGVGSGPVPYPAGPVPYTDTGVGSGPVPRTAGPAVPIGAGAPEVLGGPAFLVPRDTAVDAVRADPRAGAGPPPRLDDNTGTFTRVLLTGLGGSVEPVAPEPPPAYALPPGPPPPAPARAWRRAVATTRRLTARLAALRGDERTALVAVGAAVGLVLLLIAVLVAVARLTGGGDPEPAAPAPAAAPAAPSATPTAEPSPTGSPLPPSGGSFAARHSNLCLAGPQGRTDAGAQLVQRACGTDLGTTFLLVAKAQPDTYELVDAGTSLCADVYGASADNGAPVVQWDCNGGPNQTFQLRPLTDPAGAATGYVQLVAAHSGKCLDVVGLATAEGTPVQQNDCRDPVSEAAAGNQSWTFSPS